MFLLPSFCFPPADECKQLGSVFCPLPLQLPWKPWYQQSAAAAQDAWCARTEGATGAEGCARVFHLHDHRLQEAIYGGWQKHFVFLILYICVCVCVCVLG